MPLPSGEPEAAEASSSAAASLYSLSCVNCRNRKLKCDRVGPICTRCQKSNSECVYPESRRKPAFKRRNVRELEERLAQVEGLLKDVGKGPNEKAAENVRASSTPSVDSPPGHPTEFDFKYGWYPDRRVGRSADFEDLPTAQDGESPRAWRPSSELQGLGQFETLPPTEMIEELHTMFFQKQQHFSPFVHQATYLRSFYSAPHMRPPMGLQYAIWAMAANGHPKYDSYHDVFYRRARRYLEVDELKGDGEHFLTLGHAQAWALIGTNEARRMNFTRAAMSCARLIRLIQMMGLHRLDDPMSEDNPVAPTIAPPKSWLELEERRRVFWGAFCIDSHASITTGWPCLLDPSDITTHLPASEEAFNTGKEEETTTLQNSLNGFAYSTFAGAVINCHIFNLMLKHVHRQNLDDRPEDIEYGPFWNRHRDLDNMLSTSFMFLPERFRLPKQIRNPVAVHKNLNLHACVICLHIAACDRADRYNLPDQLKEISNTRLKTAALEIVNIMKLTSHINGYRSPLVSLSLYCAASVFVHAARHDASRLDVPNLEFLLQCMLAIGREHLITRAHLQQALLDIERHGMTHRLSRQWNEPAPDGLCGHNIPLLARSSVSKHTKVQTPLPGLLPLGQQGAGARSKSSHEYMGVPWWARATPPDEEDMGTAPPPRGAEAERGAHAPSSKRKRMGEHTHGMADAAGAPTSAGPDPEEDSVFFSLLSPHDGFPQKHMNLPHRASPVSTASASGPASRQTPTAATTATTTCRTSMDDPPGLAGLRQQLGQVPMTSLGAATTSGMVDPVVTMPELDLFSGMAQWDMDPSEALYAEVTGFEPGETGHDAWRILDGSGNADGVGDNDWGNHG